MPTNHNHWLTGMYVLCGQNYPIVASCQSRACCVDGTYCITDCFTIQSNCSNCLLIFNHYYRFWLYFSYIRSFYFSSAFDATFLYYLHSQCSTLNMQSWTCCEWTAFHGSDLSHVSGGPSPLCTREANGSGRGYSHVKVYMYGDMQCVWVSFSQKNLGHGDRSVIHKWLFWLGSTATCVEEFGSNLKPMHWCMQFQYPATQVQVLL